MSDMTHDEFLELLAGLEPAEDGGTTDWRERLPAEAARHAESCEDCARAADALDLLAGDEQALHDEPPAGYWESFDERLSARLESAGRPAARRSTLPTTLKLAAALLVALVLGALAIRGLDDTAPREARGGDGPSASEELAAEELLAAWAGESEPAAETESALAVPAQEELPSALGAPLGALTEELDDAQAAELARLLREEIQS